MKGEDQILFERFLTNDLKSEELTEFNRRLSLDSSFKAEFDIFKSMNQFIETKVKNEDALHNLRSTQTAYRQSLNSKKNSFLVPALIVFFLVSILAATFYYYNNNGEKESKPTYAELYVEPTWPTTRNSNSEELSGIISEYFEEGINTTIINQLLNSENNESAYWLAEILAREEMSDKLLPHLMTMETVTPKRRDRINYLKVLAFFSEGYEQELKEFIQELPLDTDDYYKQIYAKIN